MLPVWCGVLWGVSAVFLLYSYTRGGRRNHDCALEAIKQLLNEQETTEKNN